MKKLSRYLALAGVLMLVLGVAVQFLPAQQASAAQITNRSLTLQDNGNVGGSLPHGVVNHLFSFTLPTAGTISSIKFEYCTKATGPCTMPANMVSTSATYGTSTGATFDSVVNTTNGAPYLTSAAGVTITANEAVSEQLQTVTNPDGSDCPAGTQGACTFFVRISTYASTDTTGTAIDTGVVAASTTQAIVLNGTMPESLVFCTGATISLTASVPDCTTATSGNITFNQEFSPTQTAWATSQMAASTNAGSGYAITVGGATLTSGANKITAIGSTPDTSHFGTGQFGLDLVTNDGTAYANAPNVTGSANVAPTPDGTNYMGVPTTSFNTGGTFAFNDTGLNTVAKSDNGTGTAAPTNAQIYTTSYIVNVPGNQPAGTYTSTLTYICTPTF